MTAKASGWIGMRAWSIAISSATKNADLHSFGFILVSNLTGVLFAAAQSSEAQNTPFTRIDWLWARSWVA
jgi:hypothetical protein